MHSKERGERRSADRLPEEQWQATLGRIRGSFAEMPGTRVSVDQARALFGVSDRLSPCALDRLCEEGFLTRSADGDYLRRGNEP